MVRRSIILADDHKLVARGLASLLAPHHDVVAQARDGTELLTLLEQNAAEGVLLDLSMPGRNGFEVLPELRRRWPGLRVIVVTMYADRPLADRALDLGADGFLPKDVDLPDLLAAIDAVFDGKRYISPRVPKHTASCSMAAAHPALASLTPRQQEILFHISDDLSTAAIAEKLGLTESAISFHRSNIRRKLGIESDAGLYHYAQLMRDALAKAKEAQQS